MLAAIGEPTPTCASGSRPPIRAETFASNASACDPTNPAAVQRILRHQDPRITTEIYGHLAPGYLRDEVDRLRFHAPEERESQRLEAVASAQLGPTVVHEASKGPLGAIPRSKIPHKSRPKCWRASRLGGRLARRSPPMSATMH
jgi:hypothetical protein